MINPITSVLIDQSAEFCFHFKLNTFAGDFHHIRRIKHVEEQEICYLSANILERLNSGNARFPWTENLLRCWFGGWRRSPVRLGRGMATRTRFLFLLSINMRMKPLLQYKVGIRRHAGHSSGVLRPYGGLRIASSPSTQRQVRHRFALNGNLAAVGLARLDSLLLWLLGTAIENAVLELALGRGCRALCIYSHRLRKR